MTSTLAAATRSDQGGHPHGNEDLAWVGDGLWVVADGMGGHEGGEVASRTVVDAVRAVLEPGLAEERAPEHVRSLLADAVASAGQALRERGSDDAALAGMGTTLVVAALAESTQGGEVVVANVGDSRAYLLGPDGAGLVRLTRDDNVAEEMVALGLLEPELAATHPGQYQLTKALTAYDELTPAPAVTVAPACGRLLLCSDGLNGELSDTTMASLLARGTVDDAASALLDAALRAPARDNVTVVVVDLDR